MKKSQLNPLFVALPMLKPFETKKGRVVIRALAAKMLTSGEPHIVAVGGIVAGFAEIFEKLEKEK